MTIDTTQTSSPWTVDAGTAFTNRNLAETSTKSNSTIDMSGFLTLLTAQMQNQDPFAPMDNSQMVAQMAQFSSLASQSEANELLGTIADATSTGRLSDAANWIGKSMLVESNIATPDGTGAYAGELTLGASASSVSVDLVDGDGNVVRTLDLGAQQAGAVPFFWDGNDDEGNFIGGDALKVQVRGASPNQVATWASIAAVQSPASGTNAQLITPLGNFTPTDALRLG
jgi:flagellar basal-body rod modification protein FlgD